VKRSNRLVILVGVLLAVLAFIAIVVFLNQGPTSGPEVAKANVIVAKEAIELGTKVTPDMVEIKEVDLNAVQGTPIHDPSQVGGRIALIDIPAQAQVNEEAFGATPVGPNISAMLKTGEKAMTVQLDRTTGVDFLVKPGDIIDVVIAQDVQVLQPSSDSTDQNPRFEPVTGLSAARTVKTVLQNKRVLYVSQSRATQTVATPSPGAEQAPPTQPTLTDSVLIVFAGTDQDAELIKFAQRDAVEASGARMFTVTIRSTDDTGTERTTGITIDRLVDDYGLQVPGIVEQVGGGKTKPGR